MSLILAVLFAAQAPAAAPDWRPLGGRDGIAVSWDAGALVRNGDVATMRIRLFRDGSVAADYVHTVSRIDIDCKAGRGRVVETTNYNSDGTTGLIDKEAQPYTSISPDSFFGSLRAVACPAH